MNEKLIKLIDEFERELLVGEGGSEQAVIDVESQLDVRFPECYRDFLSEFGYISGSFCNILGLTKNSKHSSNVVFANQLIRRIYPNLPQQLIAIENIDRYRAVFMDLGDIYETDKKSPIIECNFVDPNRIISRLLTDNFEDYVFRRLYDEKHLRSGNNQLDKRVEEFEKTHAFALDDKLKIPRVHEWRPYRLCVQDIVLGLTVFKHNRFYNFHEVDVFLTASIPEYEPDSGVKGLALAILSDAFRCGGSMEIHFSKNVEDGKIPLELCDLANSLNIKFQNPESGIIHSKESEKLYLALNDPSDALSTILNTQNYRISPLLVSFAISNGIWDRNELLYIIQTADVPERLLAGEMNPEDRQLYMQDLVAGRNALLAGQIDRRLRYRSHHDINGDYHFESDQKFLMMKVLPYINAVSFICYDESIELNNLVKVLPDQTHWIEKSSERYLVPPKSELFILVRARDKLDLELNLMDDFITANELLKGNSERIVLILVPRDIEKINKEELKKLIEQKQPGVGLIMQKDFCSTLEDEVNRRFRLSRGLRSL